MVPDDEHTSLVLECFCTLGDKIWSLTDDDVAKRCVQDLAEKLGFIDAKDVVGWNVIRTRFAYPVYDLEYSGKLAKINAYLNQFDGLHIVGRTGTFRYNNADHSIEMGLLLGRKILGYDVDHMQVNTEQEYHEIKQSDKISRDHYEVARPLASGKFTSPT
jgi:protoporphyrinogen oxidase